MANKEATLWIRIKEVGEEILDRLVITIDDIIDLMMAIPNAVAAAVDAYREQEEAVNELTQSMINQGTFTEDLRAEYLNLASALQSVTTFGDEQIVSAQAILQAHIGNRKVTEELTLATLNLATAKKMDLASAAELIGKTISSETNMLSRYGVQIDEVALKNDRLGAVMRAINTDFKDYAVTAAQGLGATKTLGNAFGELMEIIGEKLAPIINDTSKILTRLFSDMARGLGGGNAARDRVAEIRAEITLLDKQIAELGKSAGQNKFGLGVEDQQLAEAKARHAELEAELRRHEDQKSQTTLNAATLRREQALIAEEQEFTEVSAHRDAVRQYEMALVGADEAQQIAARIAFLDAKLKLEEGFQNKKALLEEKAALKDKLLADKRRQQELKDQDTFLNTAATLARSSNQTLANIGKAAAITQIAIKTPQAVASSFAFGTSMGGPPLGFVFAGIAAAAMAAQAAQVAGVQLAEGGIVRARPGGIQATIGEGGQDEAVIPLDRAGEFGFGGGGGTNIIFNIQGGFLGDPNDAREFALATEKALIELRRNGESQLFDEGLT